MSEDRTTKFSVPVFEGIEAVTPDHSKDRVSKRSSLEAPESLPYTPGKDSFALEMTEEATPKRKSRRRLYLILGSIGLGVVILVAVLGGVFGSKSASKKSTSNATSTPSSNNTTSNGTNSDALPRPVNFTAIALTIVSDTKHLLLYYQSDNGSIVEVEYSKLGSSANWSVVPVEADPQTALAATTWQDPQEDLSRRIVVFKSAGYVAQTNRTENWTDQSKISSSTMSMYSRSLAVCENAMYGNAVHVFFGSALDFIQRLSCSIVNDSGWETGSHFPGSGPNAGVACTSQVGANVSYTDVYWRNTSDSTLYQSHLAWSENEDWESVRSQHIISKGTNLTAVFDGSNEDTVIVSSPDGTANSTAATAHGNSWLISEQTLQSDLHFTGTVSAWYINGTGVVYVYQDNDGRLRAVDSNGSFNQTVV